jgi:protoporphyrinogen oxidase
MNKNKLIVIGAGPMGLMAAMELLKRGHDVAIYERDDRIGGMSASFDFDGLEIERYYHFICKTDYPLFRLLSELGLSQTLRWTDTKMGFFFKGQLYEWGTPLALLKFKGLNFVSKFRYGLHALRAKTIRDWRPYDRIPATQWIRRWIGRRAYDVLWKSLFDLKLFEFSDQISAAWIGTRIKRVAMSRRNVMQETMGYLEGGSATLLRAMEKHIKDRGGQIYLKKAIEQVQVVGGRATGIVVDGETIACDAVISTVPIQYIPKLVPTMPVDFVDRIKLINNIPVACVILKLKFPLSENFWMNINDRDIEIPGIIEYSNLIHSHPAIVYAPFYMPKTHPKWKKTNQSLIDEVISYLPKINPAFRRDWVIASHCHRYEFAQTICPTGFYDMLPPMRTPISGFFMADTAYYYPEDRSINESVHTARSLVEAACADLSP